MAGLVWASLALFACAAPIRPELLPDDPTAWRVHFEEGVASEEQGRVEETIVQLSAAAEAAEPLSDLDARAYAVAEINTAWGRVLGKLNQPNEAAQRQVKAAVAAAWVQCGQTSQASWASRRLGALADALMVGMRLGLDPEPVVQGFLRAEGWPEQPCVASQLAAVAGWMAWAGADRVDLALAATSKAARLAKDAESQCAWAAAAVAAEPSPQSAATAVNACLEASQEPNLPPGTPAAAQMIALLLESRRGNTESAGAHWTALAKFAGDAAYDAQAWDFSPVARALSTSASRCDRWAAQLAQDWWPVAVGTDAPYSARLEEASALGCPAHPAPPFE